jgi:hypothetical protein
MQSIIASLAARHGLSRAETLQEIESAFSIILSRRYRLEVMAVFREDLRLEAVAYSTVGGVILQRVVDLPAILSRNTLRKYLEEHLNMAAVCKLIRRYKSFEKNLLWGEVTGCDPEYNLYVETEIIFGERITAVCPLNRIGLHERYGGHFGVGQLRAFHLRQVEPVSLNGTPRLKVVLDRVSKTLVETLLRDHLEFDSKQIKLRCIKRYVGHKSIVIATKHLPKKAIIAVDRELKERVEVQIVKRLP